MEQTADELARQLAHLERGDLARQSLEDFGALILVESPAAAAALADEIAPEHLHIATDDAVQWVEGFRTPVRFSWAITARWPWAITPPGRRTCCPPAARPVLPADCRPDFFAWQQRDCVHRGRPAARGRRHPQNGGQRGPHGPPRKRGCAIEIAPVFWQWIREIRAPPLSRQMLPFCDYDSPSFRALRHVLLSTRN